MPRAIATYLGLKTVAGPTHALRPKHSTQALIEQGLVAWARVRWIQSLCPLEAPRGPPFQR
eukprot:1244199-Alexandrium_andersonii.AAC.1